MFNFSASAKCMAMLSRFRRHRLNSIWYRGFVRGAGAQKNAQTVAYMGMAKGERSPRKRLALHPLILDFVLCVRDLAVDPSAMAQCIVVMG